MAALLVVLGAAAAATDVLMIAVDDLRPQLACTDVPGTVRPTMHTPHICGFANDSLVLLRSQVAMATSASACLDWRGTGKGCAMGYTMLTHADGATVRYTEWVHYPGPTNGWAPKWETSYGTELYNHTFPGENRNLFASVRGTALAKTLAARLHGGWEGSGRSGSTL